MHLRLTEVRNLQLWLISEVNGKSFTEMAKKSAIKVFGLGRQATQCWEWYDTQTQLPDLSFL